MSARTYACASCGAHVDEQAATPLPAARQARRHGIRCASCFHMSVPDAVYCSGCAARSLGLHLEPVGEAAVRAKNAPLPRTPSALYRDGAAALFDCAGLCGGQFCRARARLHALIEQHVRPSSHAEQEKRSIRSDPRTGYVPCPACASLMNRKNFGGTSGVIVDICKKHGTWFDAGELPRVLAFVASGGLERSRRRDAEEHERIRHAAGQLLAGA